MNKGMMKMTAMGLMLALLTGCGSIAPKEKTLILSEASPTPTTSSEAQSSSLSFEVKKISKLPLDKLDPSGIHPDVNRAIIGWTDDDNLIAMSVQISELDEAQTSEQGDDDVEQPNQRVLTQFATINYQYGFYNPILTLADVEAEGFDVSADGKYVAFVAGNQLSVYSIEGGNLVQSCTRGALASRVTFAQDENKLYFTSVGDLRQLECMNVSTGETNPINIGKSYRALAASKDAVLYSYYSQGAEEIGFRDDGENLNAIIDGGTAYSSYILPTGNALIAYAGDLRLVSKDEVLLSRRDVMAFDIASDGMHIAFALLNDNGTVDVRIGYWSGSKIINDKLTYKDLGIYVNAMFFSPDMNKLYLQGLNDQGTLMAYTFEFQ